MRSKIPSLYALAGILMFASGPLNAQQIGNPLDFVNAQLAEQLKNQMRAMSDPELIKAQAAYHRKYYLALIDQGFTKEESLQIIIALASNNGN